MLPRPLHGIHRRLLHRSGVHLLSLCVGRHIISTGYFRNLPSVRRLLHRVLLPLLWSRHRHLR